MPCCQLRCFGIHQPGPFVWTETCLLFVHILNAEGNSGTWMKLVPLAANYLMMRRDESPKEPVFLEFYREFTYAAGIQPGPWPDFPSINGYFLSLRQTRKGSSPGSMPGFWSPSHGASCCQSWCPVWKATPPRRMPCSRRVQKRGGFRRTTEMGSYRHYNIL